VGFYDSSGPRVGFYVVHKVTRFLYDVCLIKEIFKTWN